ncbi:MAG: hypothetical protein WCJ58_06125 [bacterium]
MIENLSVLGLRNVENVISPLDEISIVFNLGEKVEVTDGVGRIYLSENVKGKNSLVFLAGGAIGTQTVKLFGIDGECLDSFEFELEAKTKIVDNTGKYSELMEILEKTIMWHSPSENETFFYKNKTYEMFWWWLLDHYHMAKGGQFFSNKARGLVDLFCLEQSESGMIWSNIFIKDKINHVDSKYGEINHKRVGESLFSRQPVENHCEYIFVNTMFLTWKANGDDFWLKSVIDSGIKALNYSATDKLRWSEKYKLLKRAYTIDSWDFSIKDEYTKDTMLIDEETKFGIFFGDNNGYYVACKELSIMLEHLGRKDEAKIFSDRGDEILRNLDKIAWNGRFYTHRIEEDETLVRDLGVNEKSQIAMSNCYAVNRGITHEQSKAIIETYLDLLKNLPKGSPGEWYSIYPPFEKGFIHHDQKWDYMNAGVHGHAAGELALGAFKNGYESYGIDILNRVHNLAKKTNGKVSFAYTGAYEEPTSSQEFKTIDLSAYANMNLSIDENGNDLNWMCENDGKNHFSSFPAGEQEFSGVPYKIAGLGTLAKAKVIAVGENEKIHEMEKVVEISDKAVAIYILHTANDVGISDVAGVITLNYEDGTSKTQYILKDKHLSGWWYPSLENNYAGIAWEGENGLCKRIGLSWCVIQNPCPEKIIRSISFSGSQEGSIYTVFGITLANEMPYVKKPLISFGGPDNWAGGTCMLALIEGLAGVENVSTKFDEVKLSPRWANSEVEEVKVTARFEDSNGYISYKYISEESRILLFLTGSGNMCKINVLLSNENVKKVKIDGIEVEFSLEKIEESVYCTTEVNMNKVKCVEICF